MEEHVDFLQLLRRDLGLVPAPPCRNTYDGATGKMHPKFCGLLQGEATAFQAAKISSILIVRSNSIRAIDSPKSVLVNA